MPIPKIIHQTWRTADVPAKWRAAVDSVRRMHRGWDYRLWTDGEIDSYVHARHPGFFPVFASFNRHIMRVDAFRYVLMHDFGGLFCDLDYEFVRPYRYDGAEVLLSYEFQRGYGDAVDQVANYVMASAPRHPLWADILAELRERPPRSTEPGDVCTLTGPGLVTRVLSANRADYPGVVVTDKPVLSPRRVHGRHEKKFYINSGVTFGFHHGWGSWKQRLNVPYLRRKLRKYGQYVLRPHL